MVVLIDNDLLHGCRKGFNGVAGSFFSGNTRHADGITGDFHGALGAGEEEALALFAAVNEVDTEAESESLLVIEEAEDGVGCVTAVLPVAEAACCHGAYRAVGSGDEVRPAEKMDEEVAGDAAAIGLPLTPLEEMLGVEGNLGRSAKKARPIAGLFRGVGRDGVIPCAHGRVAIPAGGDHVELTDGSGGQ